MAILSDRDIRNLVFKPSRVKKDRAGGGPPELREPHERPLIWPFSERVQEGGVISYGLGEAGYDLRLGTSLLVFKNTTNRPINPKLFEDDDYKRAVFDEVKPERNFVNDRSSLYFMLPPHGYALGYSLERLDIPIHLKGHCLGKSSYARCGIIINVTPAEPDWAGHLTLEISNSSNCPAILFAEEGICQIEFHTLTSTPEIGYSGKGGKYQGQGPEPVPSKVKR